jgi:replicative DNA helicase
MQGILTFDSDDVMADFARCLISKIVSDKDIVPAMSAGIKAKWFEDEEHRRVFAWMLEYFSRYGEAPTRVALKKQFPAYRLIRAEEPYAYYIDHFRDQRRRLILVDSVIAADEALKNDDHGRAQTELTKGLLRVGTEVSSLTDEDATKKLRERFEEYRDSTRLPGELTGITTGFPTLDMISGGWQPQQFILFGGMAKQSKSFLLLVSAIAAQGSGRKVLFLTFEMSVKEQLNRYYSIFSGVNSMHVLQKNMTTEEHRKLKKGMAQCKNLPSFIVSADNSASTTISTLAAKIEQHQPDVVYVDGCYLMDNEVGAQPLTAQAFTSISRGLKRLAQRIDKPVICTTQALSNKMKDNVVTMHSLGWSSAWSQDADLILGVEKIEKTSLVRLRVVAGRNVAAREISVNCDFGSSIFEEVDSTDGEYD